MKIEKFKTFELLNFLALRVWRKVILNWNDRIFFPFCPYSVMSFLYSGYVITHPLMITTLTDIRFLHCTKIMLLLITLLTTVITQILLTRWEPVYEYIVLWNDALSYKLHATLQLHNSPADGARELFKPSKDSQSLLVLGFGSFVGDFISGVDFWPFWLRLPGSRPTARWKYFTQVFIGY